MTNSRLGLSYLATGHDTLPTRTNILLALLRLRNTIPADGLLFISFIGHGTEQGGRSYLLPSDAAASEDRVLLEETAIRAELFKQMIKATGAGRIILLLDTHRDAPMPGVEKKDQLLTQSFQNSFRFDLPKPENQAFVLLTAASVGQRSYWHQPGGTGFLTEAVSTALLGRAVNSQGEVTLADMLRYVQQYVPSQVSWATQRSQQPIAIIEGFKADELVLIQKREFEGVAIMASCPTIK